MKQVSYGSELSNRGPTFDMDLSDFMEGEQPIPYEKATYEIESHSQPMTWLNSFLHLQRNDPHPSLTLKQPTNRQSHARPYRPPKPCFLARLNSNLFAQVHVSLFTQASYRFISLASHVPYCRVHPHACQRLGER